MGGERLNVQNKRHCGETLHQGRGICADQPDHEGEGGLADNTLLPFLYSVKKDTLTHSDKMQGINGQYYA